MPFANDLADKISFGGFEKTFADLYGERAPLQKERYLRAIDMFVERFGGDREVALFSVPGRAEITGNHTDHNHGAVLAAAINLDIIAVASRREDDLVQIHSEGFIPDSVDLRVTDILQAEKETSASLIRGIGARLREVGFSAHGFDAYTTSDVLKGSGISSSAAFEVMVTTIQNHFYNGGRIDPVTSAIISSYAENNYYGKPSGLMDQTACSAGGFAMIDFKNSMAPVLEKISFDFAATGYTICAVDTGSSHADLTYEYASMPTEMRAAASVFGKHFLREVDEKDFLKNIPLVRAKSGDRAVLRAIHFFDEHRRVLRQVECLKDGRFEDFLKNISESGRSSFMYLQNVYTKGETAEQATSVALAMTEKFLQGRGAFRVHGGGFAGIILSFIPNDLLLDYIAFMESVFGTGSVRRMLIREAGAVRLA